MLERGEVLPVVLPPWVFETSAGDCTTLVLLAPPPTQFVVRIHPFQDLPSAFVSRAGAFQLTRCGKARISLVRASVELRSPRAVLYPLVAVGAAPPKPLEATLPMRDPGDDTPVTGVGPAPERDPVNERLRRFQQAAQGTGASGTELSLLPAAGSIRVELEPGCHRLLVTPRRQATPVTVLVSLGPDAAPQSLEPTTSGDVHHELCTLHARSLQLSLAKGSDVERSLAVAHFPLPQGLPLRFGGLLAERLLTALGQAAAPRKLGPLVGATLGAQGRTPLPKRLLPHTCYLAVALVANGTTPNLALRVAAGGVNAEASGDARQGARVGFCTNKSGRAEVELEARGLGLSWLCLLFQQGPSRWEEP